MTGWAWVGAGICAAAVLLIFAGWVTGDNRPAVRMSLAGCGAASVGAIWMAAALAVA